MDGFPEDENTNVKNQRISEDQRDYIIDGYRILDWTIDQVAQYLKVIPSDIVWMIAEDEMLKSAIESGEIIQRSQMERVVLSIAKDPSNKEQLRAATAFLKAKTPKKTEQYANLDKIFAVPCQLNLDVYTVEEKNNGDTE